MAKSDKQEYNRRTALGLVAGFAALVGASAPSYAKYGEPAGVFAKKRAPSEFIPYQGNGFNLLIPNQWEPSPEVEEKGQLIKYDDHFDVVTNLVVLKEAGSGKTSIDGYGSLEEFIRSKSYLLGQQTFDRATDAEGGFKSGKVAAASILDANVISDKKGNKYYYYELLTRTADGDEGGRHQLIKAGVKGGNLYILKVQSGDKRWIKGQKKNCVDAVESFSLA